MSEPATPVQMRLPAVSLHLTVLEQAGLIERWRAAQWHPCRLRPDALQDVAAWLTNYRRLCAERFDRLDTDRRGLQAPPHEQEREER